MVLGGFSTGYDFRLGAAPPLARGDANPPCDWGFDEGVGYKDE